jgi:hypothetical protein
MGGDEDDNGIGPLLRRQAPLPHLCRGGAHCCQSLTASSTAHPPAANSSCDCHRRPCHRPRCLLMSMLTSYPLAATALRDGRRCCHPCLPPRRWLTLRLHPTATTALRDRLRPCLPPCCRSTSRVDIDVASYRCHRHAQSSSSSPSLSLPPVNIARPRCILPPSPPAIFIVIDVPSLSLSPPPVNIARRRCILLPPPPRRFLSLSSSPSLSLSPPPVDIVHRRRILPPPPTCAIFVVVVIPIPVLVPVPAACQRRASTTHPPAATTTHDLCRCHCPHPCPCPRRLSTSRVDDASSRRHCLVQGGGGVISRESGRRRGGA